MREQPHRGSEPALQICAPHIGGCPEVGNRVAVLIISVTVHESFGVSE